MLYKKALYKKLTNLSIPLHYQKEINKTLKSNKK